MHVNFILINRFFCFSAMLFMNNKIIEKVRKRSITNYFLMNNNKDKKMVGLIYFPLTELIVSLGSMQLADSLRVNGMC